MSKANREKKSVQTDGVLSTPLDIPLHIYQITEETLGEYRTKPAPTNLSAAFKAWLLSTRESDAELCSLASAITPTKESDFPALATLGFAAGAGVLSESQIEHFKTAASKQAGWDVSITFPLDAVATLGFMAGVRFLSNVAETREVVTQITKLLQGSYDCVEDWQRCLMAVVDRQLGSPLNLPIPDSLEIADVRLVIKAKELIDADDQMARDVAQAFEVSLQKPPKSFTYDRMILRLAATVRLYLACPEGMLRDTLAAGGFGAEALGISSDEYEKMFPAGSTPGELSQLRSVLSNSAPHSPEKSMVPEWLGVPNFVFGVRGLSTGKPLGRVFLGDPLDQEIGQSKTMAHVRAAHVSRGSVDLGDRDRLQEDTSESLTLATRRPPINISNGQAVFSVPFESVTGATQLPGEASLPIARKDGYEGIVPTGNAGADQMASPTKPLAQSSDTSESDRSSVVLGNAGQSDSRPTGDAWATDSEVHKLVEKDPSAQPYVNLMAHLEQARAEGEVNFRQRELNEQWGQWCGVYPWAGEKDPDTTDCPWWMAGAEYVYQEAAAWRKHSPGDPKKIEGALSKQIEQFAHRVYWRKVYVNDVIFGKNSTAEHILVGHAKRFHNIAFVYSMRKFAESDLDEWRGRASFLAGANAELKREGADQSLSQLGPGISVPTPLEEKIVGSAQGAQVRTERYKTKKPRRRNQKYILIDVALRKIAESGPSSQREVFLALEERHVVIPPGGHFDTARGWMAGFRRNEKVARSWLSKRWAELNLPPLPRGPKNRKK